MTFGGAQHVPLLKGRLPGVPEAPFQTHVGSAFVCTSLLECPPLLLGRGRNPSYMGKKSHHIHDCGGAVSLERGGSAVGFGGAGGHPGVSGPWGALSLG